ncbi:GILT-like protein 1 [Pseudolycoriella hygida]|uniref:GILT-like protein 1 n=1 Tax=Pseudolycoriella hygida TaxID=35572 RepID=A0A9Q0NGM0_9DIPT|nr:GILT-like protein 1 [Pseudolycoriella hygida]
MHSNDNETKISSAYGPVLVMVFYEALCPDSKYFIIKQLQTAYYKAPALIDFQLIPYGKATTTTNADGSLAFTCQHGEIECNANIYHACCVEAIDEPKILIDVIACMIKNNVLPKEAMQRCAKENQVEWEPIQKCYDRQARICKRLLIPKGSLSPPINYVCVTCRSPPIITNDYSFPFD